MNSRTFLSNVCNLATSLLVINVWACWCWVIIINCSIPCEYDSVWAMVFGLTVVEAVGGTDVMGIHIGGGGSECWRWR